VADVKPKLLVVELWGLGDLAIASPFIRAAAEKYEVTLLAKPFAKEMRQRFWPEAEVIPFTAPWTAFAFGSKYGFWRWPWAEMLGVRRELAAKHFDYAVSARWDPRDHFLLKAVGARERIGFSRLKSERYLTQALVRPEPVAHRFEHWRKVGSALGLELPQSSQFSPGNQPKPQVVLIHSGARLPLRVWPLKNFLAMAARLREKKYIVHIACDPDQLGWWRDHGENAICPKSVTELLSCLDGAGVFIGNDSGPGHLAARCGLPTFTLFGPQLHEWFLPLHLDAEWVEGKACPYKPCSDYCRYPTPYCLWKITDDEVWPRIQKFVRKHLQENVTAGSTTLP